MSRPDGVSGSERASRTAQASGAAKAPQSTGEPDFPALMDAVAVHRDRAAFAALFEYFAPRVKSYLLRAGASAAAAEELTQETMLAVWSKASYFKPARGSVSTWIFTIARNRRSDAFRRERPSESLEPDAGSEPVDPLQPPDVVLSEVERETRVRAALSRLSEDQARVIRLSFFHDKAHGEIARDLGIPLGTVKSRLRLAMNRLRLLLGEI